MNWYIIMLAMVTRIVLILSYTHTIFKKSFMTQMNLENTMLSEISWTHKGKYCTVASLKTLIKGLEWWLLGSGGNGEMLVK